MEEVISAADIGASVCGLQRSDRNSLSLEKVTLAVFHHQPHELRLEAYSRGCGDLSEHVEHNFRCKDGEAGDRLFII